MEKKSYVFLADGFEEIEALTVVDVLRRAGLHVVTVSVGEGKELTGAHGVKVVADELFANVDFNGARWLILPGGMPGASNLAAQKQLCELLKLQNSQNGGIAAICASPSVVLGPLGILEGKKAVCYPGMEKGLKGAHVVQTHVVRDGNVITGNGPSSATEWALAIVAYTVGEDSARDVAEDMLLYTRQHKFWF